MQTNILVLRHEMYILCSPDHCMIQFVKPNLLGTKKEFMNRFVNPIEQGQCLEAMPRDVRRMKRRAHILHNMLEGCVQVSSRGTGGEISLVLYPKMAMMWYILGLLVALGKLAFFLELFIIKIQYIDAYLSIMSLINKYNNTYFFVFSGLITLCSSHSFHPSLSMWYQCSCLKSSASFISITLTTWHRVAPRDKAQGSL